MNAPYAARNSNLIMKRVMNEDVAYLFFHRIQVHEGEHWGYDVIESLIWKDMPWAIHCKYKWYFDYRAALLKVKYPKYKINHEWGKYEKYGKSHLEHLKSKESAAKGQITKLENKIKLAKTNWNKLFPIEDNLLYRQNMKKLEDKKDNLKKIQIQIKKHENQPGNTTT